MESVKEDVRHRSTRHGFLFRSHLRTQRSAATSPVSSDARTDVLTPPRDESKTSSSVVRSKLTLLASDGLSECGTSQRSVTLVRPLSTQSMSRTVVDHSPHRAKHTPISGLTKGQLVNGSTASVRKPGSLGASQTQEPGIFYIVTDLLVVT